MALTPEQQAKLNALTLEQVGNLKEIGELNQEELEYLSNKFKLMKETSAAMGARLEMLNESIRQQETLYTFQIRSREAAKLALDIAAEDLNNLGKRIKAGEELNEAEQKRFEVLSKGHAQQEKAYKDNQRLINETGHLMENKIGGAIARVGDMMSRDFGSRLSALNNSISALSDKGFSKLFSILKSTALQYDSLTKSFERNYSMGPAYTESITSQWKEMNQYGVSMEDAVEAQTALITGMTDFTMLGQAQRDSITQASALLGEQGIAQADFAKGMQNSTKFFGQSASAAIVTQQELAASARALGRVPAEFASEFAAAGPQIAKFGEQGIKAFKDLSRISKITGMEMNKVLSITNKFDTFEGAAEQAGKLNAAMGGNMVNAMDMMMETDPAARFETLRESIMNTVGSFDDMSYYQKQFYTESLGLGDVSDLALMMAGDMDSLSGAQNQNAESLIEQRQRAEDVQSAQEQLAIVGQELIEEFVKPMADGIQKISQFMLDNTGIMKGLLVVMGVMKVMSIALAIAKGIETAATIAGASADVAASRAKKGGIVSLILMAAAIGAIALALRISSPSKVVLALFGFAAAIYAISKVGEKGAAGLQAIAIPLLQISVAVFIVAAGVALMAAAFSLLSVEQMLGMAVALLAFGTALYFGAPALGGFAAAMVGVGLALANPVVAIGLAIFAGFIAVIAGSIFVVAAGVGLMGTGLSLMFEAMDVKKTLAFVGLIAALALAGPFLIIAGVGFGYVGLGMLAFALALKMISTRDLEAMGEFATGMAEMNVSSISRLVTVLREVAQAMDDIPTAKAIMLTATLDAAAIAASAANAMVGTSTSSSTTKTTPARSSQQSSRPINVHVTLELDGDVLDKRIIKTSTDAKSSGGLLDTVAHILG
tara:strand:- start:1185 stop:3848 length:2664 start_codon:yes stop_codon:yes gene_type:complete